MLKVSSDRFMKPCIQPVTPGLQGQQISTAPWLLLHIPCNFSLSSIVELEHITLRLYEPGFKNLSMRFAWVKVQNFENPDFRNSNFKTCNMLTRY